ncbi:MAG TPA: carboxypeptidase-like regulatory domain-containing protein [Candidatus Sulfotelmatobacter sp.]|nr:carboxypeptidase-like regulatory domain-containing protein [Candidatus Sulfotelmatobacter sp.]
MMRAPHFALLMLSVACLLPAEALAQGETTSAIVGEIKDATNAVVPGATVTITNHETGLKRSARTDDAGRFNFPQLKPGTYSVRVEARGFDPGQNDNVVSGLGQKQSVDFTLKVARSNEAVEVSSEAPLINPENANTSTTLSAPALEDLPNPGGDLTYPLQFAPGALINTAGSSNDFVGGSNGYGNVEFNGLPALSNGYIVDGLETNDPLTNLNSGLSTNLVLGLNSISEVTVNTLSYSVDQGRYGASQVDYVTKSGTNQFHGNLYELWNGSLLNAADYFTNATPGNHKPGATVNHFGGSVGGPIAHDKLFFFFDSEWVRIALPIVTPTIVPSTAFQAYVLQQLSWGQTTGCGSSNPNENCLFYQHMFNLYGNANGTPTAILGCPLGAAADGCANRQSISHSSDDHEQVQTVRLDYNVNQKNTAWFRFQSDSGLQAAYTDPINPVFNALSPQPLYSFAAGHTHVFSQNLVNYFNPAFSWYESLFGPTNLQKTLSAFPIVLQGSGANAFTPVGGLDNTWIQGRRASRFFINDNLAWSHGAHELRFGTNTRIFRLNDYDFGEGTVPTVTYANLQQFIEGVANTASETFPSNANEPFNFLNLDVYAQDTWKVTRKLTWTFGLRDTFNSNPLNPHDQVARLRGSFSSIVHDNQPLNAVIQTHLGNLFSSTPVAILQPRTAVAWQFEPKSVLRTGFGIFSDILPGTVADLIGTNPPYDKTFQGGQLGTVGIPGSAGCDPVAGCTAIAPGAPNSALDALVTANRTFTSGFPQGLAPLPPPAITAIPDGKLHAPYFMEWSLGMEHQFGTTASLKAQYVGTRAVNQPYSTQVNGFQTVCQGCFAPFPYLPPTSPRFSPTDPRFGAVTQFSTGANSHYNGLQLTAMKRLSHGLQGQVNYTWSRCMDTVSNGGFLPFSAGGILSPLPGDLARDYGPCDYDIRHNLNAQYVYQLPVRVWNHSLGYALNGWQISGTAFWHSGVPFSVLSTPYSAANPSTGQQEGIVQGSGPQFASIVPGVPLYEHHPIPGVTQAGTLQWLNPDAFVSAVDPSTGQCYGGDSPQTCQFGSLGRNALRGPDFLWSDFYLTKLFSLTEHVKLRVEGQFFNVFNHPNFALPSMVQAGIPGNSSTQSGFGALTSTTSPPTGLLGVGLGGDSSPRMIAFQARLEF